MFGIFLGACYGGFCRLLNNLGRRFKLVERQSFLAHVIGMALGVVGVTTLIGEGGSCARVNGFCDWVNGVCDWVNGLCVVLTDSATRFMLVNPTATAITVLFALN
jgi:hypothetical protein